MNEAKPIVTCHGNKPLFSSLHQMISQGLPKEPCEWRRSYGRPPRNVHLGASFVPYDSDILPDDDEKTLVSRPYFHIFWTDCDLESYKQSVKDEISEWLSALKAKSIPDWMIVVVTSEEKAKAKLLPRSSVIDKVRNDHCSKFNDRCIILTDPLKLDSKSSESWSQLLDRLRFLLLQAYNRILNKYEESMRNRREKRNEPGWNYFTYFIFQEELAFMLEILGLKEDALIQYDELDAMFDQFIQNHANGKMVKWLTPLLEPCTCWAGVSLAKSLDLDLRDEVKQSNVSLLDFRNYLFSRQAALLFQMKRAWEAAQRAMTFVYQTMGEMKALEIEITKGGMSCWVFLSCLEVLYVCNKEVTGKMDAKFALHTASLWDFAHKKLQELGNLCSLMPGLQPSSDQLSLVVDLVSGMGVHEESLTPTESRPLDKLRESLSSPESFKRHYLEMCEQAMGTYKYIGRYRSSRMIGKEIADFYMKIGEPEKAESFLLDAIRMYQKEAWHQLADGTIKELAQCQKLLGVPNKYVKTACHIACSLHLPSQDKEKYFEETMKTLEEVSGNLEMRASQAIFIDAISLDQISLCVDETLNLTLALTSNFPKPVAFSSIQLAIMNCSESEKKTFYQQQQNAASSQSRPVGGHQRTPSLHYVPFNNMANFQPVKRELPTTIQFRSTVERQKGRTASCGVVCDRAHDLLKRIDSSPLDSNAAVTKGDYSLCFNKNDVTLTPGSNDLSFSVKITEKGVYKLEQMCCTWKSLQLLKPLASRDLIFEVISLNPQVVLKPKNTNEFIAGVEQEATLTFTSGSNSIAEGSTLTITTSPTFTLRKKDDSGDITLPEMAPLTSCDIPVVINMNLKPDTFEAKSSKAKMKVQALDHIIEYEIDFLHPFTATHRVYTMDKHKFIQVTVQGNTLSRFSLSNARLQAVECPDVELVLKNNSTLTYPVSKHQSVSFLWQLNCNIPALPVLDLIFICSFSSVQDDNKQSRDFSYSFRIQDFQTQYVLSYEVSSMEEDKSCVTGESAVLDIRVRQLEGTLLPDGSRLAYTVKANGSIWAIGGKSSGVFTMKDDKHHIILDVVPMQPGFLHFPLVTLYKYSDHVEEISKIDMDEGEEDISEDDSAPLKPVAKTWSKKRTDSQISLSSLSSGQLSTRLIEFYPGQVYNKSRSQQIHVYPCKTTPDIAVSLVR